MSDTPRTDAEALKRRPPFTFVTRKFAEELERECNQRKADWNKACDEQGFLMLECDGHRAKAAKLREALRFIAEWGGRTLESEYGDIDCNGKWCAEQAKEAAE